MPLGLFRSSFFFYIELMEDSFRKNLRESQKSCCQAIRAALLSGTASSATVKAELDRLQKEVMSFKENIIMNYKSVYLAGKLRDLFIQSGKTMELILPALEAAEDPVPLI